MQGFATGQKGSAKCSTQPNPSTVGRRCQEEAEWGQQCIFTIFEDFLPQE